MKRTMRIVANRQNSLLRIIGVLIRFSVKINSMEVKEQKETGSIAISVTIFSDIKTMEKIEHILRKQINIISVMVNT